MTGLLEGHIESWQDLATELAYLVLCYMAWRWAVAAIQTAWDLKDVGVMSRWRWAAAGWLTSKAVFFTFVGTVWWFDYYQQNAHTGAILLLAFFHALAYHEWRKLPIVSRPGNEALDASRFHPPTDERRTADAIERIADQGDALAQAGVAARSATATERLADAGDSMSGRPPR